jgi:hypothetical protein
MLISGVWYKWIGIGSSRIIKLMMMNGIVLKKDRLWQESDRTAKMQ